MIEGIGDSYLQQFIIDALLFFLACIIGIFYILKKYKGVLRWSLLYYLFITFSAYNIFIKPVQDYLIPIPRTFIYYYKIFDSFSCYDMIAIILVIYIFVKCFIDRTARERFTKFNILNAIFFRDLLLLIIGLFGVYMFFVDGGVIDWDTEIRGLRGILNAIIVVYFSMSILKHLNTKEKKNSFLNSITTLNFINITSEFISGRFLQGISWERAGHSVFLLDQINTFLFIFYIPMILVSWPFLKVKNKIFAFAFCCLIFLDYHKIVYLELMILFVFIIIIGLYLRKKIPFKIKILVPIGTVVSIVYLSFILTAGTDDMRTREGQLDGVIQVFEKHPMSLIFGIGSGGMFPRQQLTEDEGEIRAIDLENNSNLQSSFQTPLLFRVKESGIIGLSIVFIVFISQLILVAKMTKKHWYIGIYMLMFAISCFLLKGLTLSDPQASLYYGIVVISIYINIDLYEKDTKNTLIKNG